MYTNQESGGQSARREFRRLLPEACQQKFDLVVFWRLDRFSREGALSILRYLKDHGVEYRSFIPTSAEMVDQVRRHSALGYRSPRQFERDFQFLLS